MTPSYRIAIVGAASIRGKQLSEALAHQFCGRRVPADGRSGGLRAIRGGGDETTFIQPISADSFERVDFTFFGGAELTRRH